MYAYLIIPLVRYAGVDNFISFVNFYVAYENAAELRRFIDAYARRIHPPGDPVQIVLHEARHALSAHGAAFDRGFISCSRMVEVLVPPFLKLLKKFSQGQMSCKSQEETCDKLLNRWHGELANSLTGVFKRGNQGAWELTRVMQPKKRKELVKALVAARLPEV